MTGNLSCHCCHNYCHFVQSTSVNKNGAMSCCLLISSAFSAVEHSRSWPVSHLEVDDCWLPPDANSATAAAMAAISSCILFNQAVRTTAAPRLLSSNFFKAARQSCNANRDSPFWGRWLCQAVTKCNIAIQTHDIWFKRLVMLAGTLCLAWLNQMSMQLAGQGLTILR